MALTSESNEILTLQFGQLANYAGTHFWNFQDELLNWYEDKSAESINEIFDPYVFFDTSGEHSYPRLVAFDASDNFCFAYPAGQLDGVNHNVHTWSNNVTSSLFDEPLKTNSFQNFLHNEAMQRIGATNMMETTTVSSHFQSLPEGKMVFGSKVKFHPFHLDESVSMWTDYLKVHRRKDMFQGLPFRQKDAQVFQTFSSGVAVSGSGLWDSLITTADREKYFDAIRHALEKCNRVQGFLCFTDLAGGWPGLASDLIRETVDECPSASVLHFPLEPKRCSFQDSRSIFQSVNKVLSLNGLYETSSLILPLSESNVISNYERNEFIHLKSNLFYSSALIGSLLDVTTTSIRLQGTSTKQNVASLIDMIRSRQGCNAPLMKFSKVSAEIPFVEKRLTCRLSRDYVATDEVLGKMSNFSIFDGSTATGSSNSFNTMYLCRGSSVIQHDPDKFFRDVHSQSTSFPKLSLWKTPLAVPISFPLIFRPSLDVFGEYSSEKYEKNEYRIISEISGIAKVENVSSISFYLKTVTEEGLNVNSSGVVKELQRNGIDRDDAIEIRETMRDVAALYE